MKKSTLRYLYRDKKNSLKKILFFSQKNQDFLPFQGIITMTLFFYKWKKKENEKMFCDSCIGTKNKIHEK